MEQTLAIIKPDAVAARYTGRIIQRIEEAGFQIRAMRLLHCPRPKLLRRARERPFFGSLTSFMASGPVVVLALEAEDAIKKWRALMGAPIRPRRRRARCARSSALDREQRHARIRRARTRRRSKLGLFFSGHRLVRYPGPAVSPMGKLLLVAGLIIAAVGALMMFGVPFGRLPGDFVSGAATPRSISRWPPRCPEHRADAAAGSSR